MTTRTYNNLTTNRIRRRAFAWAALLALSLLLASLLQAMATKALVEPVQFSSPGQLSPATAALADGDDVHAHFVASLRAQGPGGWSVNEHNNPGAFGTQERCIGSVADPAYAHVDMDSSIVAESRRGMYGHQIGP
jgi:hypothetical protein